MAATAYERFLNFFKSAGRERLDGLDRSYFDGMPDNEKERAFDYLLKEFQSGSSEAVDGLQALSGRKIYDVFMNKIIELRKSKSITEQRLSLSISLWQMSGDVQYQDDMIDMLEHPNEFVRAGALSALEQTPTTSRLIKRLEKILFEDPAELIIMAAAQQLLRQHGLSLDDNKQADSYKSIYKQLKSEDINEKKLGLSILKTLKK